MDSSPAAAPAPDYTGAAQATAAGNLSNLNAQTVANRPDQTTPWGTSTWTQSASTPDTQAYQSALAQWQQNGQKGAAPVQSNYTTPGQWSQTITLTPAEQQALNSQQTIQQNQSGLAQSLQGQVASTMAGGFNAPSLSSYMGGVGSTNQNFSGYTPSGVNGVNQSLTSSGQNLNTHFTGDGSNVNTALQSNGQNVNTNAAGAVAGAGTANTNAPQFSDATAQSGAQAAYNAQMALIQPQLTQDTTNLDSQLRLQGLTPGTEAYNNAAQNLQRTQAQTTSQIANQAVLTGNTEANNNYTSALAGYNAQNAAQNQAYSQAANTYALGNTALGQQYSQDANTFNANNTAAGQQYNQNLGGFNANNAALSAQYGQDANTFNANNTAQGQAYNQALATYGANQSAQQASNAAQNQAYTQAQNAYSTAYSSALQNYLQPLNSMNAVLNGQQVSTPSMPTFATAGYTPGADYSGATNSTGSYNQSLYNSQAAAASSNNSAMTGLAGAGIMALAMY